MTIEFTVKELEVISELAEKLDLTPQRVVVLSLRYFQLHQELCDGIELISDSPGCGVVE